MPHVYSASSIRDEVRRLLMLEARVLVGFPGDKAYRAKRLETPLKKFRGVDYAENPEDAMSRLDRALMEAQVGDVFYLTFIMAELEADRAVNTYEDKVKDEEGELPEEDRQPRTVRYSTRLYDNVYRTLVAGFDPDVGEVEGQTSGFKGAPDGVPISMAALGANMVRDGIAKLSNVLRTRDIPRLDRALEIIAEGARSGQDAEFRAACAKQLGELFPRLKSQLALSPDKVSKDRLEELQGIAAGVMNGILGGEGASLGELSPDASMPEKFSAAQMISIGSLLIRSGGSRIPGTRGAMPIDPETSPAVEALFAYAKGEKMSAGLRQSVTRNACNILIGSCAADCTFGVSPPIEIHEHQALLEESGAPMDLFTTTAYLMSYGLAYGVEFARAYAGTASGDLQKRVSDTLWSHHIDPPRALNIARRFTTSRPSGPSETMSAAYNNNAESYHGSEGFKMGGAEDGRYVGALGPRDHSGLEGFSRHPRTRFETAVSAAGGRVLSVEGRRLQIQVPANGLGNLRSRLKDMGTLDASPSEVGKKDVTIGFTARDLVLGSPGTSPRSAVTAALDTVQGNEVERILQREVLSRLQYGMTLRCIGRKKALRLGSANPDSFSAAVDNLVVDAPIFEGSREEPRQYAINTILDKAQQERMYSITPTGKRGLGKVGGKIENIASGEGGMAPTQTRSAPTTSYRSVIEVPLIKMTSDGIEVGVNSIPYVEKQITERFTGVGIEAIHSMESMLNTKLQRKKVALQLYSVTHVRERGASFRPASIEELRPDPSRGMGMNLPPGSQVVGEFRVDGREFTDSAKSSELKKSIMRALKGIREQLTHSDLYTHHRLKQRESALLQDLRRTTHVNDQTFQSLVNSRAVAAQLDTLVEGIEDVIHMDESPTLVKARELPIADVAQFGTQIVRRAQGLGPDQRAGIVATMNRLSQMLQQELTSESGAGDSPPRIQLASSVVLAALQCDPKAADLSQQIESRMTNQPKSGFSVPDMIAKSRRNALEAIGERGETVPLAELIEPAQTLIAHALSTSSGFSDDDEDDVSEEDLALPEGDVRAAFRTFMSSAEQINHISASYTGTTRDIEGNAIKLLESVRDMLAEAGMRSEANTIDKAVNVGKGATPVPGSEASPDEIKALLIGVKQALRKTFSKYDIMNCHVTPAGDPQFEVNEPLPRKPSDTVQRYRTVGIPVSKVRQELNRDGERGIPGTRFLDEVLPALKALIASSHDVVVESLIGKLSAGEQMFTALGKASKDQGEKERTRQIAKKIGELRSAVEGLLVMAEPLSGIGNMTLMRALDSTLSFSMGIAGTRLLVSVSLQIEKMCDEAREIIEGLKSETLSAEEIQRMHTTVSQEAMRRARESHTERIDQYDSGLGQDIKLALDTGIMPFIFILAKQGASDPLSVKSPEAIARVIASVSREEDLLFDLSDKYESFADRYAIFALQFAESVRGVFFPSSPAGEPVSPSAMTVQEEVSRSAERVVRAFKGIRALTEIASGVEPDPKDIKSGKIRLPADLAADGGKHAVDLILAIGRRIGASVKKTDTSRGEGGTSASAGPEGAASTTPASAAGTPLAHHLAATSRMATDRSPIVGRAVSPTAGEELYLDPRTSTATRVQMLKDIVRAHPSLTGRALRDMATSGELSDAQKQAVRDLIDAVKENEFQELGMGDEDPSDYAPSALIRLMAPLGSSRKV